MYASKGGRLEGPAIPCVEDEFVFYRGRFESRFTERGYYAVLFQDATGKNQIDDVYGAVEPSTRWAEAVYCFRGRAHSACSSSATVWWTSAMSWSSR